MATKIQLTCIVHLDSVNTEGTEPFTKIRWDKCREVAEEWLELDGNDKCIAEFFVTNGLITKDIEDTVGSGFGFHPTCYRRFTDKTRLLKAIRRCEKKAKLEVAVSEEVASTVSPTETTNATTPSSTGTSVTTPSTTFLKTKRLCSPPSPSMNPSKKLKSHHDSVTTSSEVGKSILPPDICIICQKESKYVRVGATRKRDNLVQCATKTAGSLLQAAEQKKDERILIHIRDQDCVAMEVKYHSACYKNYCRFLSEKPPRDRVVSEYDQLHSRVYAMFCEDVLQKKLIENKEIITMTTLTETFNNMIKDNIGENSNFIRADRLKYKIKKDFPQLAFCPQPRKNLSELVYIESLLTESFTTGEITGTNESDIGLDVNPTKTHFDASLIIKMSLAEKSGTSSDLNLKNAPDSVPLELFNFITWVTGSSEKPILRDMVNVSDDIHLKILRICQDIVCLASGGRK